MEIKELFEAMKHATDEQNDAALSVFDDMVLAIKKAYPGPYKEYANKLDMIYNGKEHLSEEEALEYTESFVNKDGSTGPHWSLEQVKRFMANHSDYSMIDPNCFYVAINMMYSDYYRPTRTVETYAALAKDFLMDKDAPQDKLHRYIEAMRK